ncbi:outer membrane protein [Afipia sp. TerB]
MKKILLATTILTMGVASASAADLAPYTKAPPIAAPIFTWTGFYIGADVGYGFGRSEGQSSNAFGAFPLPYSYDPDGIMGGGFIGANYQFNQFVIGIEADWQAADLNGDSGAIGGGPFTLSTSVRDYGSVRGRLGIAFDRVLLFGTGGWAWGSFSTSYAFTGFPAYLVNRVDSSSGWAAGAGIEYAFTNNVLARIEYRYTDLGSTSFVSFPTNTAEAGNRVTINDVRVGIAYKF